MKYNVQTRSHSPYTATNNVRMSLVVLRAGRGFRVGESQRVEFMPDKGQIEVDVQDGLARFCRWWCIKWYKGLD